MSVYVDYIKDFPNRILKLYDTSSVSAKSNGFEVTFLLSLTTSSIAVPLYRLRKDERYPDPFENRIEFKNAADKFDKMFRKRFRESELWDEVFQEWLYGTCDIGSISPNSWEEISSVFTVKCVIEHLRNSLAHGVIITNGNEEKEINEIQLFTGKKETGLKVLRLTPHSLEKFLHKWVNWLRTFDLFHQKEP